ncbi:MAG TPA: P22 phage major capsid protein family protein [Candidatus Limnocylindrales bacterium]|nr:P22 phage major capsid protein family protein [Candidatus Limnocylindrales bacterium]
MAFIVDANLASQLVTLYAAQAVDALQPALVMGNLINRAYDNNPGSVGNTVNVPVPVAPGGFTSANLAEGSTVSFQAPNISTAQLVVNKHRTAAITIPDMTQAFTNLDIFGTYIKPLVIQLASDIEADIFALYSGLTANTAVGVSATTLTDAVIDSAETSLFAAYVPPTAEKFLVVSPTAYSGLRQIGSYVNTYQYGPQAEALRTGELGSIKGFKVFRSQLVPKPATTTFNIAFAKDAFAMVTRNLGTVPQGMGAVSAPISLGDFGMRLTLSYNPQTVAVQAVVDCLYGVSVLRNQFGIQVLS